MTLPKIQTDVTFLEKIPQGAGMPPLLVARQATVVALSTPICAVCHEPEAGHARPNRRHAFTAMDADLLDLDVSFPVHPPYHPVAEVVRMTAVPRGDGPNTWS